VGNLDPLYEQAKRLVSAANILAISTFTPAAEQYDFLKECDPQDWDFFATAAIIQVALNNLARSVSAERFKSLYAIIASEVHNWNSQGEEAILDCRSFIKRMLDAEPAGSESVAPIDALGMWVILNLLRREPTYAEAQASRAIGGALAAPLHDWWDKS
jgi:hypothetical protein